MTKSGPQKYPGASLKYFYQGAYPGDAMESNVGVIHTTEGRTLPSYDGGVSAPNFTAMPDIPNRKLVWYQHFDFDVSSRALVNKPGGVQTNTANAVQVELVGTCDERNAATWDGKRAGVDYIFWPDAPDWALAGLGEFVKWSRDNHGVKAQSTVTWKAYNKGQAGGSYGNNGVRLTGAQWDAYYGWLGHQHVPENDHGDPGNVDFAKVIAYATGAPTPPTTGTEMTKPNRSLLRRTEDMTLVEGVPQAIYWTTEYPDDANGHGEGGKTVGSNIVYDGIVNLRLAGLGDDQVIEVYAAEEDGNGNLLGESEIRHQIRGRMEGFHPIAESAPVSGHVTNRLVFRVVSRSPFPVTVEEAWLSLHSWPLS